MPDPNSQSSIEKLTAAHVVTNFDCGQIELNRFIQRYAYQNQQANSSQTYLGICWAGSYWLL
jgi:hypothetical protein